MALRREVLVFLALLGFAIMGGIGGAGGGLPGSPLAISAAVDSPNLVDDGGFESPNVGGAYVRFYPGQSFSGWTVNGADGNVAVITGSWAEGCCTFPAESGGQWLDMTGTSQTKTGIEQKIDTEPGVKYELEFSVGNVFDGAPQGFGASSSVAVFIDGARVMTAVNSKHSTRQVWQKFKRTFTASSKTTTIGFRNEDPSDDTNNGLDSISVVPECAIQSDGLTSAANSKAKCATIFGFVEDYNTQGQVYRKNGVKILLTDPKGKVFRSTTGGAGKKPGEYRFKGLKNGTYTVTAPGGYCLQPWEAGQPCNAKTKVTVPHLCECDVSFRSEAYDVEGEVWGKTALDGRNGVKVQFYRQGRKEFESTTGGSGTYKLKVRAGTYTVKTTPSDYCWVPAGPPPEELESCTHSRTVVVRRSSEPSASRKVDFRAELYSIHGVTYGRKSHREKAGVRIHLTGPGTDEVLTSAANGIYSKKFLKPGSYVLQSADTDTKICTSRASLEDKPCHGKVTILLKAAPAKQDFTVVLPRVKLTVKTYVHGARASAVTAGQTEFQEDDAGFAEELDGQWTCMSGCFNVHIEVRDPKTGKLITGAATVKLKLLTPGRHGSPEEAATSPVVNGDPLGTICQTMITSTGATDCASELDLEVENGILDLYEFVPGVIDSHHVDIQVTAETPDFDLAQVTVKGTVEPNHRFDRTVTMFGGTLSGSVGFYNAMGAIASPIAKLESVPTKICEQVVEWLSGNRVVKWVLTHIAESKVPKFCEPVHLVGALLKRVKLIISGVMLIRFVNDVDLPPSGLIGRFSPINPIHILSTLEGAFLAYDINDKLILPGLLAYTDLAGSPAAGEKLRIQLYEVSAMTPSFDVLEDKLYGSLEAKSASGARLSNVESLIEWGYSAGQWLNAVHRIP